MLEKAAELAADEIVVDLEDGVASAEKEPARDNLDRAAARGTLALRINAVGTPWWRDDIASLDADRFDVVVVPKVSSVNELSDVAGLLPAGVRLEAQIETARGLVEVERIAALGPPLEALVFGPGDFAASIGVPVLTIGAGSSDYALARIVVAARAFGLQVLDGPWAALDDDAGLAASARRALALGCDGKWVIHPAQIDPVNEVFTPTAAELERARRIAAAADGVSTVDGEMVDAASKRLAEGLIARAGGRPSVP
jgi:citrate lyase beta subunit